MTEGTDTKLAEVEKSPALLGILPIFLRHELLDDRSFRFAIRFETEELITYGKHIAFPRSLFIKRVGEIFKVSSLQTQIIDQGQKTWTLCREEIASDRIVLKIASETESFFAAEFFVFLPDASERLREFDAVLREHGFPQTGLSEWRTLLMERTLTSDELEKFSQDIMKTPFAFLKMFRRKIETTNVGAEDMVPKDIEYYENLCGRGDASTFPDLVNEIVSGVVADYLAWDDDEGPRMALLLCSHPLICHQIANSDINDQQLIKLAEWARDRVDVFSKVSVVEIALASARRLPELERTLDDIVQQIISLDPEDKSGPLQMMMSLIVLVESEVSRTRLLSHWPPFRRRLATFSQAALLAREADRRTDVAQLSAWIMENHRHRFYLHNLIDLRTEPRWLPNYVSPAQLKQELLGRLYNAVGSVAGGLPDGPLHDSLDPSDPEIRFNRTRTIRSSFPGPLEGADSSLRNPIPQELEDALDRSLSGGKLTAESIAALINTSVHFRVGSGKAERVVEAIKTSNFRFAEQMGEAERFSLVHGLAEVACRLRSESLAKSVRALARSHREDSREKRLYSEEVIVCLVAAGAFEEFDTWKDFIGEWTNELCFNVKAEFAGDLGISVEMICLIEPRLRLKLGAGLAALASVR